MKKHFLDKTFLLNFSIILFFCFIPIPVLYPWFSHGTIIYFWDTNFPLDPHIGISHFFYLWKTNIFPGFFDPGWSWLPYVFLLYVFNTLFHSLSLTQMMLYWMLIVVSLISFYYLLHDLFTRIGLKDGICTGMVKIIGAILYAFNTYVYYYSFRIFNPQEFIVAFLPLNFLALLHLFPIEKETHYHGKKWLFVFFLSGLWMVSGFSTVIYYIEYLIIIVFYLIFQVFYRKEWSVRSLGKRGIFFLLVFTFNFWWLFPIYLGIKDVYTKASNIGTTVYFALASQLSNLLNALRLIGMPPMQTPLFHWEQLYISNRFFTFPLFIFPFCILLLALKLQHIREKGIILFFLTIFLLLLFIVKEANPPFSFILQFAFAYVPFFGVFRDAYQKAGLFYMFAYMVLFSLGLGYISSQKEKLYYMLGVFVLIAGIVLTAPFFIFYNIPFLKNRSHTFSAKTTIPKEYTQLKSVLESDCKQTTVLVIPRTSILSSGYWQKTNSSYIGQDIMSNLINCNFISTQVLDPAIDAVYSVPYVALQQHDMETFKNFLLHTGIRLLVVRHDYLPNDYTDFERVDPQQTTAVLNNDTKFTRIYNNALFDVYQYNIPTSYGITFTQETNTTNNDFTTEHAPRVLYKSLPPISTFINTSFSTHSVNEQAIVFGNCIGCEYLPGSSVLDEGKIDQPKTNPIKKFVQQVLQKKTPAIITIDTELGLLELAFESWTKFGTSQNARAYEEQLAKTISMYTRSLQGDFFTRDYLTIKVKNYLINEYNSTVAISNTDQNFADETEIENLQQNALAQIKTSLWETDFSAHKERYRLDIPTSEKYTCSIDNNNLSLYPRDVSIDGSNISLQTPVYLMQGSYKAEVSYASQNVFAAQNFVLNGNTNSYMKIPLTGFSGGNYYALQAQIASGSANNITILIDNHNLTQAQVLSKLKKNQSFLYRSQHSIQDFVYGSTDYFFSSDDYEERYYLYIIAQMHTGAHQLLFSALSITPVPTKDSLVFSCVHTSTMKEPVIPVSITQNNPTMYTIHIQNHGDVHNRILTFNQSFHPLWQAYTVINGKQHRYSHVIQAGYANAWYIDTVGKETIYISFIPQREAELAGTGSILLFIILFIMYMICL